MHGMMRDSKAVYITAAIVSIILSFWASISGTIINPDAVCYLQGAQSIPMGLNFVTHLCDQSKWPFYSILIYGVASVTKLSYVNAAFVLNGLFTLISVITFISILRVLRATPRILWLGALVILLAHEFNAVREYIIRDHGFWAFYLVSIFMLLRFFDTKRWMYALGWSASLIIATLFRIEGLIFLLLMPFTAWFLSGQLFRARLHAFLKLNTITILGFVGVCAWLALHPQKTLENLGRLNEIQFQILHGLSFIKQNYQRGADALAQHVLSQYSAHDAKFIMLLMLMVWYVVSVVENLSFIYMALVVYAWCRRLLLLQRSAQLVLWGYVLINLLVTTAFLAENMFLSKRYLLALSITLMLWVPFALDNLVQQWRQRKWPALIALLLIVICAVGGIFRCGYSKQYIQEAGQWINIHVPQNASVYSNDYQVMYYSYHFGNDIFVRSREFINGSVLENDKWKQFDYIALRTNKNNPGKISGLMQQLGTPIQIFMNKRGDEVVIYKVH